MKDLQTFKAAFFDNFRSMTKEVDYFKQNDKRQKAETLNAGETLGHALYNGFYYESNKETAGNRITEYRHKAQDILNDLKKEYFSTMAEIPTEETSRALQSMQLVTDPDPEYISAMFEKHGNNFTAYQSISEYAKRNDIRVPAMETKTEIQQAQELYNSLQGIANKMDVTNAESFTDGQTAFYEMALNNIV